jgi:hypothetical protein
MDYLNTAFGGFAPHGDEDASVKFALNAVLVDRRLDELMELTVDASRLGGIEGEPGWIIERRDVGDEGDEEIYPGWPKNARFRAYVDPNAYQLKHPELFMSREDFMKYVVLGIRAYVQANPDVADVAAVAFLRGEGAT